MTKRVSTVMAGKVVQIRVPKFLDFEGKSTIPAPTLSNARIAVVHLPLQFAHDQFRDKRYVGGIPLTTDASGQVTDDAVTAVRLMIREQFGFDPGKNNAWDAVHYVCRLNGFHPVKDYLQNLPPWDGVKRIDRFFTDYMGAPDTDLTHGISRIVLLASIRRVYEPGCKFDYMTVLEGPEGRNKSSAIAALYGKEFVSDQSILGVDDKQLQEAVRGRWAIEAADLSGMRKADVDRVKAQLSRLEDRSRPAYGRAVVDAPRSCIFFGTTNETEYLRSQTGNRRFFPLPVEHIKVADISRDRDQIWAEAMLEEQFAESIMLPEPLWKLAAIEQDKRTIPDPWAETLRRVRATETTPQGEERISSHDLLHVVLGLSTMQSTPDAAKRLGTAMRKLGWNGPDTLTIKGKLVKGYARIGGVTDEEVS